MRIPLAMSFSSPYVMGAYTDLISIYVELSSSSVIPFFLPYATTCKPRTSIDIS